MPKYEHLGLKTFWVFVSERGKIAAIIGGVAVAFSLFGSIPAVDVLTRYLIIIFFIALLITIGVAAVEYRRWEYMLDADALRIKRGVFQAEELAIPYRQIQNADIERNLINQLTGTSSLVILTAGHTDPGEEHADSEGVIPVMDRHLAENLQKELLTRANIQKVIPA